MADPVIGIPPIEPQKSVREESHETPVLTTEATTKTITTVAAATAIAQTQTAETSPKKHIWKTIGDGFKAPFIYIALKVAIVWASLKEGCSTVGEKFIEIYNWFSDDEQVNLNEVAKTKLEHKKLKEDNDQVIKNFENQLKDFKKNEKNARKLIGKFDVSTPEKLLTWVKIPDAFLASQAPAAIIKAIEAKLTELNRSKEKLQNKDVGLETKPTTVATNPPPEISAEQKKEMEKIAKLNAAHALILTSQIGKLETLLKETMLLVKSGEAEAKKKVEDDVITLWINKSEKSKNVIEAALNDIQQKTLKSLQEKSSKDAGKNKRADLKFCLKYLSIYHAFKKCDLIKELSSAIQANHAEIERLSGQLSVGFNLGIDNRGNTCWLNSGLQAIGKSSALMKLLRNKLDPLDNENPAQYEDRLCIQDKLIAVFDALGLGSINEINEAVANLEKAMLSATTDVVPYELRHQQGRQKDPTDLIRCIFNVINYKIPCVSIKTVGNKAPEESDDLNGIGCLSVYHKQGKTFDELVAGTVSPEYIPGYKENDVQVGCTKVKKLKETAPIPEVLVTAVQRLAIDTEGLKELEEIRDRLSKEFPQIKGKSVPADRIAKAAEALLGVSWGQLNVKNNDPIQLTFDPHAGNYILDLTHSSLTDRLPRFPDSNGDLTVRQSVVYRLVSVINHHGGMNGGHYTACGMMPDNLKSPDHCWDNMNDGEVTALNAQAAGSNIAHGYVFVWERYTGPVTLSEAEVKAAHEESSKEEYNDDDVDELP